MLTILAKHAMILVSNVIYSQVNAPNANQDTYINSNVFKSALSCIHRAGPNMVGHAY